MIEFGRQVERLRARQGFAARMHTRRDIVAPAAGQSRLLSDLLAELDPVLDYRPDELANDVLGSPRCPLPYGIRSVRYCLSPIVQTAIGSDGRVGGMLVRRMPETLAETVEFVAHGCPVDEANWGELRRLIYVDPAEFAALLYPLRASNEPLFRLILSREYRLALSRYPILATTPENRFGFNGTMIDLCVTFGEMERCDYLGMGLVARQVDTKAVRHALLDQQRMISVMADHTPAGEYLLGLLTSPDLLLRGARGKRPTYGPWSSPDPLAYNPLADFADERRYSAFVDDVLSQPLIGTATGGKRRTNANLATYWGADLAQLAEITFLAAGDIVQMRRGTAIDHDETSGGRDLRERAIRVLADGFRERHDAAFKIKIAAEREAVAAALRKADLDERSALDESPPTPVSVRLVTVGASRIQQSRDRASLLAPQPGLPGHASAIDGNMWLSQRGDRALWRALCTKPPSRTWLDRKGIDAAAKRAFEKIRAIRASVPELFEHYARRDARLLADLATAVGWLSGQPRFTARVKELVDYAPKLRMKGWLAPRTGARWGGGGNPEGRKERQAERVPHRDEIMRVRNSDDQPS